jgi:hypothetical protein
MKDQNMTITKYTIKEKLRNHLISVDNTLRLGTGEFESTPHFQIIIKFIFLIDEYRGELILNRSQIKNILTEEEFKVLLEIIQNEFGII